MSENSFFKLKSIKTVSEIRAFCNLLSVSTTTASVAHMPRKKQGDHSAINGITGITFIKRLRHESFHVVLVKAISLDC